MPVSGKFHKSLAKSPRRDARRRGELVIITGMSGSGKASVLKAFEDLGYYCVDNMPIELILRFAEMARGSSEIERTALVVDVREGQRLEQLPPIVKALKKSLNTTLLFLETGDDVLVRRFSETRRPHPLAGEGSLRAAIGAERKKLRPIRQMADVVLDT